MENWKNYVIYLNEVAKKKKIKQRDIAEMTGIDETNISRFFKLKHCPSLDLFLKVAKSLEVDFELF